MDRVEKFITTAAAALGGVLGAFLGGFDGVLIALLICIALDILTGLGRAGIEKKINSTICYRGMVKKVMILAMVGFGYVLDLYVIKSAGVIRTAVIFFYLANEGISILENAAVCGLPIPGKLRDALEQLKDKSEADHA